MRGKVHSIERVRANFCDKWQTNCELHALPLRPHHLPGEDVQENTARLAIVCVGVRIVLGLFEATCVLKGAPKPLRRHPAASGLRCGPGSK